jgi:calcium permeable stress-gated cation channel
MMLTVGQGFARFAGIPSLPMIETYTQSAYFAFQVIQVFLVTTLTSAASAAITDVITNPLSAKDLLSANLPKASNFYLSYILIQSLALGATTLVQPFSLFRHQVLAKSLDNPRRRFKIWHSLRKIHWGSIFPLFTNLGVIGKFSVYAS